MGVVLVSASCEVLGHRALELVIALLGIRLPLELSKASGTWLLRTAVEYAVVVAGAMAPGWVGVDAWLPALNPEEEGSNPAGLKALDVLFRSISLGEEPVDGFISATRPPRAPHGEPTCAPCG